ncbi:MAG: hypothetical protein JSV78_14755 [Phycisphaerales bacterium]|nr:MAG: hypothetical protein JSV78_14755 [Phycisphaerales bacterium]
MGFQWKANVSRDPVVIPGDELPCLLGSPLQEIVAFSCQERWKPIPAHIEEHAVGMRALAFADVTRHTSPDDDFDLLNWAEFMGKFFNQ